MDYLKMIIYFLILSTLIDQLFDKSMYRPYIRLITGFMLISLMIQPISKIFLKEDIVTMAVSRATDQTYDYDTDQTFRKDLTKEKQEQVKEQITKLLSDEQIKSDDVVVEMDQTGKIVMITIKGKGIKKKKKLKTIISNFYNMKESNINISE